MTKPNILSGLLNTFAEVKELKASLEAHVEKLAASNSAQAKLSNDLLAAKQQLQQTKAHLHQRETAHLQRVRELEERLMARPATRRAQHISPDDPSP